MKNITLDTLSENRFLRNRLFNEITACIRNQDSKVKNHEIPVIAYTANVMQEDRERCLAAGMNDYLSKPLRTQELTKVLQSWLPRHEVRSDLPDTSKLTP